MPKISLVSFCASERGVRASGLPEEKLFIVPDLATAKKRLAELDAKGKRKAVLFENNLPDNH